MLALYVQRKQKYQNGRIHRKLKISTSEGSVLFVILAQIKFLDRHACITTTLATNVPYSHSDIAHGGSVLGIRLVYIVN